MTKYIPFISEVEIFNETMGKPNTYTPNIPKEQWQWEFVYNFILEELNEYKEACVNQDITGVADALGDIMYVLCNGILMHGFKSKFEEIYNEIQASNMSKACKTEQEAIETSIKESERIGEETYYEKVGEYWIVYRKRDKKVLKSINYFPPNLKKILE
jgi:phosphoribosyl-ATP pyrophosphohydrolase